MTIQSSSPNELNMHWDGIFAQSRREVPSRKLSREEQERVDELGPDVAGPLTAEELIKASQSNNRVLKEAIPPIEKERFAAYQKLFEKLDQIVVKEHSESKKPEYVVACLAVSGTDDLIVAATNHYAISGGGILDYYHAEENLFQDTALLKRLVDDKKRSYCANRKVFPGVDIVVSLEPCAGARQGGRGTRHKEPCSIIMCDKIAELEEQLGENMIGRIIIGAPDLHVKFGGIINLAANIGIPIDIVGPIDVKKGNDTLVLRAIAAINERPIYDEEGALLKPIAVPDDQNKAFIPLAQNYTNIVWHEFNEMYKEKFSAFNNEFDGIVGDGAITQNTINRLVTLIQRQALGDRQKAKLMNDVKVWFSVASKEKGKLPQGRVESYAIFVKNAYREAQKINYRHKLGVSYARYCEKQCRGPIYTQF